MAKKKVHSKPSNKLPVIITSESLPNGDPIFNVQTAFSVNFTSTHSNEIVVNTLAEWLMDFYTTVSTGGSLKNTPFENFKVKLHPKEAQKSAEEAYKTVLYYILRAGLTFNYALPIRLSDLPEQLITEVFISVVQEMEDAEVFSIEGGRADVWDDYTNILGRTLKRSWNNTLPRGSKYWTPEKRKDLLKVYNYALRPLQQWWKKYHSSIQARRHKPTAKDRKEAAKKHPHVYPYFSQLSELTMPSELALQYVSDVTGHRSLESLRAQLSKARKEAGSDKS